MKCKDRNKDICLFPLDLKAGRRNGKKPNNSMPLVYQGYKFGLGSLHHREESFQPQNNVLFLAVSLEKADEEKLTDLYAQGTEIEKEKIYRSTDNKN